MKFRKKPVVIEAVQFTGDNVSEVVAFAKPKHGDCMVEESLTEDDMKILIPTLEGTLTASAGDWIIREVKGELYPCKPDIFEATYDPVED